MVTITQRPKNKSGMEGLVPVAVKILGGLSL